MCVAVKVLTKIGEQTSVCSTCFKFDLQFAHRVAVAKETQLSVEGVQPDSGFQTGEGFTCGGADGRQYWGLRPTPPDGPYRRPPW